jgi:hypothetical protein
LESKIVPDDSGVTSCDRFSKQNLQHQATMTLSRPISQTKNTDG